MYALTSWDMYILAIVIALGGYYAWLLHYTPLDRPKRFAPISTHHITVDGRDFWVSDMEKGGAVKTLCVEDDNYQLDRGDVIYLTYPGLPHIKYRVIDVPEPNPFCGRLIKLEAIDLEGN